MWTSFTNIMRDLFAPAFSLDELPGFPTETYNNQLSAYEEMESWFTGEALANQPGLEKKSNLDYYPMHINPLKRTCYKHAYMLFGEAEDSSTMQVVTKFIPRDDTEKNSCEDAEHLLAEIWEESNGRALLMENAIQAQIFGGCVFKVSYVPWESQQYGGWRRHQVRVEAIRPQDAVLTPSSGDFYRLTDGWIVKLITASEAREYGYPAKDEDVYYYYTEHWDKTKYIIRVNEQVAVMYGNELQGENIYKLVPMQYIPHLRAGNFLGLNVIDDLKGIIRELNLRMGDYGDAVNDDAHPVIAIHDVSGVPRMITVNEWLELLDLHDTMNMTGSEKSPGITEVSKQRASTAMRELVELILDEYRRDSFTPAVADGEDEGSQRSGMTLATRFWPLISHASMERFFWTPGLNNLQYMILKILQAKNLENITENHLNLKIKQQWAPQLPRDREADVQEWNLRKTSEIASIQHLLGLSGDVEDVDTEYSQILKNIEDVETIKAKIAKQFAPEPTFPPQKPASSNKAGGKGK